MEMEEFVDIANLRMEEFMIEEMIRLIRNVRNETVMERNKHLSFFV